MEYGKSVLENPEMAELMKLCGIRLIAADALPSYDFLTMVR